MKTYKPKYKYKGKSKPCQCWYINFVDNRLKRRRIQGFTNKRTTENAADKIKDLLSGVVDQTWLEQLPAKMRNKLIAFGLIDNQRLSPNLGKPLDEHLKDFCAGLAADDRKAAYVRQTQTVIKRVLNGCRFKVWSEIDGNKVKTFLAKGRRPEGYGQRTYNSYLRAFKEFCAWLIQEGRVVGSNPMDSHKLIKQTEFRKKRRALTMDEQQRLLEATEAAPSRFNMTGHERALVYRLALQTGLRANELRTLTVLSFDLTADPPTVHVEPSDTKGKKPADMILIDDTAAALQPLISDRTGKAFAMPHKANTATMLKRDLEAAGIEYTDESDRDVDFHALRHTFITNLALAKVHPSVAQVLARHSSIELTMKYYTHVLHESEVSAISALKFLTDSCPNHAQRRTTMDNSGQRNRDNEPKTAIAG